MRKVKGGRRLLTALLCASLVFQHVSLTAFADEEHMTVEQQTQENIEECEEITEGIQEESRPEESTEPHAEINSETELQESSEESISTKASETEVESSTQSDTATQDESSTQLESDSEGETVPESETESESSTESETEETVSDTEAVSETETMTETEMEELKGSREGNPVSRIDWLRALTAAFELDVDSDLYPDNYYSDIDTDYTYYHDVMTATEYGLIDVEAGEELNPDDNATREFAAFTMNMCVGYVMEDKYTFSEEDTVSYPEAIQVAIDNGWLLLDGSDFNPNDAITEGDKDYMISVAREICALRKIDAGHKNTYELAEGVIEIPEGTQAEWSGEDELTITDCPKDISVGSIFVLFDCGIPLAYRAVSVETSGNKTIISVSNIDNISDAFTSLDVEGVVSADLTAVSVNDTDNSAQLNYIVGGTAEEGWEDGVKYDSLDDLGGRKVSAVEIVEEFELADYVDEDADLTAFGDINTDKFTFRRTVSNPKLNYRYANNTLYCTVTGDLSIFCSINVDLLNEMPSLDSISLNVTPLLCSMNLDAVINQTGAITCNYLGRFEVGLEYNPRTKCNAICRLDTIDKSTATKVENTIGIRASVKVKLLVVKGTFYVEAGIKSGFYKRTSTKDSGTTECLHVYSYLYAKYGASVTIFLDDFWNKSWNYTKDVFTRNNSPIRVAYHYENGELVSQCSQYTRSDGLWGNGTNAWFYNTPANSRYGYGGGSTGYVDGEPYTIFEYTLNDTNEATITKYNGNVSSLQIPDELDGHTVVGIGSSVFEDNTRLRMVVIPNTVTEIGSYAFYNCSNLTTVQLSDSLTSIAGGAFYNCASLESITIPKSLNTITLSGSTKGIFYGCDNLRDISFEKGITKIPCDLFANCGGIEKIEIPNTVTTIEEGAFEACKKLGNVTIPDSVTSIEYSAFYDCISLTSIIIPDSVTSIGGYAFGDCSKLSSVTLSKGVASIEGGAFYNCDSLESITIPKSLNTTTLSGSTKGVFYGCDNLRDISFEKGITKIPCDLFANCGGIEKIEIPNTVTTIEEGAFEACKKLGNVTIPDSVTSIEYSAFYDCISLTSIVIPDSVTSIEAHAFGGCSKLSSVTLSKRVASIEGAAFYNCDSLESITIPKSLNITTLHGSTKGVFYGCDNLRDISFEKGITNIPRYLFANCGGIEKIEIPNTVTTIETGAFETCKNLGNVTIPNSLASIESSAFSGCTSLAAMELPDSVTSIGNYAFNGCTNLASVKLPDSITTLSDGIFKACSSLTAITIPETVTEIEDYAFQDSGLTQLSIPKNVAKIYDYAFDGCESLQSVSLSDGLKQIGAYAFRNNDALSEISIPNGVTSIGNYAFYDCDALTAATIPDSTTSIGQYIFAGCDSLKDVKLGTGLTKIPTYAFNLCPELEKIVIPYRVTTIESNAFTNCTKLTEVTIPRGTTSISSSVFSYPGKLTIYGISGTYAETYANSIGATFVNKEVNATEVTLSETSLSVIKGATHKLVVSITPENFTDEVVWKSSDTNVLTVDDAGMITAKAVGTATVRVAVGDKTASCTVKVVQPVTSISLNKSSISLDAFEEYKLTATVYPDNAADPSVEWTSSNEAVATVTQDGKVVPVAKGTATIKVSAKDGSGRYASCSVTVVSDGQLCSSPNELESEHNYANNVNKVWKYTHEGAKTLDVTFDSQTNVDDGFDFIYLYDGSGNQIKKASGTELANQTVRITGDTVKIKLVSDEAVTAWGFKVSKITTEGSEPEEPESSTEEPSEEESSTEKSSEEESSTEKSSEEESSAEESSEEESSAEESSETEASTEEPEKDITDGLYISGLTDKTYTGSPIKQEIKVYYNKTLLQENKDYSVIYKNNKNAGTASITVKGKGNLTGSDTKYFQIRPRDISDTSVRIEDTVYSYDNKVHKKPPVITYNGKSLKAGKDFEVTDYGQGNFQYIDTYTVKIKGIGNFTGSYENAKVIIVDQSRNLSKAKVKAIPVQEYRGGAAVELSDELIKVTIKKKELKKDSDYTVSYVNNVNPGKATLIIKGIGEYAGTKKISFTIRRTPVTIVQSMVVNLNSIETVEMVKGGAMPEPILRADGYTLIKDKDYKVTYKNHKKTGSKAAIVVKGIGNFKGSITIPFTIVPKDISSSSLTIRVPDVPYTGKANKYQSRPIISDCDGNALTLNKDYTIEAYKDDQGKILDKKSNPENGTTITITISGKGNYYGTTEIPYKLRGMNFAAAKIRLKAKPFTGHAVLIEENDIISADMKQNKVTAPLVLGKDFEIVAYKNNVKKGTASVTFRGIGDYAGEKTVRFKINSANIK